MFTRDWQHSTGHTRKFPDKSSLLPHGVHGHGAAEAQAETRGATHAHLGALRPALKVDIGGALLRVGCARQYNVCPGGALVAVMALEQTHLSQPLAASLLVTVQTFSGSDSCNQSD